MPETPKKPSKRLVCNVEKGYVVYLPELYHDVPERVWPLIVFLHGKGERGNTIQTVKNIKCLKSMCSMKEFPFVVVAPQCPKRTYWDRTGQAQRIGDIIKLITGIYHIDTQRLYLTGYSMGGYGSYFIASHFPEMFAAIAPLCGSADATTIANLMHMPIWIFHGGKDRVVSVSNSRRIMNQLENGGNSEARMTIYPDIDHDCWSVTYRNTQLYTWFLGYDRS